MRIIFYPAALPTPNKQRKIRRMSDTIIINGDTLPYAPQTLGEYLAQHRIGAQTGGIAVAINNRVIPRAAWATTTPQPNDHIEIITALGGG